MSLDKTFHLCCCYLNWFTGLQQNRTLLINQWQVRIRTKEKLTHLELNGYNRSAKRQSPIEPIYFYHSHWYDTSPSTNTWKIQVYPSPSMNKVQNNAYTAPFCWRNIKQQKSSRYHTKANLLPEQTLASLQYLTLCSIATPRENR